MKTLPQLERKRLLPAPALGRKRPIGGISSRVPSLSSMAAILVAGPFGFVD